MLGDFKAFHKSFERQNNCTIRLHTDNGGEVDNEGMNKYLEETGISMTTEAPHTPQSNGIAE